MSRGPRVPGWSGADAVSLSDRQRWVQLLRLVMAGVALALVGVSPELAFGTAPGQLLPVTGLYLLTALSGEALWWLVPRLRTPVFGALLVVDAVWLGWLVQSTGGTQSPLRYLVLVHLVAATLLGSYRVGLTLALWHTALLVVLRAAVEHRYLPPPAAELAQADATSADRVAAYAVSFWVIALVTATASAVNERELRRRRYDGEALARLAERLEDACGGSDVASRLLGQTVETFGVRRGVVVGAPDGSLGLLATRGASPAPVDRRGQPRTGTSAVVRAASEARRTRLLRRLDTQRDGWLAALLPGARRLAVVPLTAEGRPVGAMVLELAGSGAALERRTVEAMERFAAHGALALRNAWLLETVQRSAETDGLTRIANRRTFEARLEADVAAAARSGTALSLVLLDIDHFKALNDSWGHQVGDDVLRAVAGALAAECRERDLAARWGGEEFVVLLPGCGSVQALLIAERLRRVVAVAPGPAAVTTSAGVATYPDHAADPVELVRAADDALYRSKGDGRDRVTVAGPRPGPRTIELDAAPVVPAPVVLPAQALPG